MQYKCLIRFFLLFVNLCNTRLVPVYISRGVTICFNSDVYYSTRSAIPYKNGTGSCRAIQYDTIQWLEIDTGKGRKCRFLCSGRGGNTLEMSDALNYTNIQFKASIQSVWSANADWKLSFSCCFLPWSTIIWRDTADTIHMPRTSENEIRVLFTTIYHYNFEKYIHMIMFDMLDTRHKFLVLIQLSFAPKNYHRSIQVTQEGHFDVYLSMQLDRRNVNQCIDMSMYRYTPTNYSTDLLIFVLIIWSLLLSKQWQNREKRANQKTASLT